MSMLASSSSSSASCMDGGAQVHQLAASGFDNQGAQLRKVQNKYKQRARPAARRGTQNSKWPHNFAYDFLYVQIQKIQKLTTSSCLFYMIFYDLYDFFCFMIK